MNLAGKKSTLRIVSACGAIHNWRPKQCAVGAVSAGFARKLGNHRQLLMQRRHDMRKMREPAGTFLSPKSCWRKNLLGNGWRRVGMPKPTGTMYAIQCKRDRRRTRNTELILGSRGPNPFRFRSSTCSLSHDWSCSLPAEARGRVSCDGFQACLRYRPLQPGGSNLGEGRGPCDSSCPGAPGATLSGTKPGHDTFLFAPPRHEPAGRIHSACGLSRLTMLASLAQAT